MRGILLSSVSSGSGKTVLSAGIVRALVERGESVLPIKVGPDYIDSQFLELAGGVACVNIDLWAMSDEQARGLLGGADFAFVEGVMGLFDGGKDGRGSSADVSVLFGWPVVLVLDVRGQGESLAAVVRGLRDFRSDVCVVGVIFNRVVSDSHVDFLRSIMLRHHPDLEILGFVREHASLSFSSRHLGLVQAVEDVGATAAQLSMAAADVSGDIDLSRLRSLVGDGESMAEIDRGAHGGGVSLFPCPSARHIAVARDEAFSFVYSHLLRSWESHGIAVSYFSPLRDESPIVGADAVFLPGGYPELHAETLSCAEGFRSGMLDFAAGGGIIYGECGGYMVMGESLVDFAGVEHRMLGLFGLRTSFMEGGRRLGYRRASLLGEHGLFGGAGGSFGVHEFHRASITYCSYGDGFCPLWVAEDSLGESIGEVGHLRDNLSGSFLHVIAQIV